jgi:hypothetical protein
MCGKECDIEWMMEVCGNDYNRSELLLSYFMKTHRSKLTSTRMTPHAPRQTTCTHTDNNAFPML